MLEKLKETIIISLGGSVVAPGEIDVEFLKNFKKTLQKYLKTKRFFIFTGGGKIARLYQKALSELGANDKERDEIGVNVTRLNGEIVKHLFSEFSYPEVIINPTKKIKTEKKIIVGAGWRSGWSTDYVSVLAAKTNNIKTIVNLTNIDYVYDKNPKEFPGAKAIKEINWPDFRKIVGDKWSPGLSLPFDPRASELAEKLKLRVIVINGKKLERLGSFLNNKPFMGTIIQ